MTWLWWVLGVWLALAGLIAWGWSRWMRFLRGDFDLMNDPVERFGLGGDDTLYERRKPVPNNPAPERRAQQRQQGDGRY